MEGDNAGDGVIAVLGGIGAGGRSGGEDMAEVRGEPEEGLRNEVSKDSRISSSSSSLKMTEGMDGDGCRTEELYERSVVEAHAWILAAGGRKEVDVWVKLVVADVERVSSESKSSGSETARDVGVTAEGALGELERGNGESRLSVSECSMFNDVGVATSSPTCSVDGINGESVADNTLQGGSS
jgi:hypothetical protein